MGEESFRNVALLVWKRYLRQAKFNHYGDILALTGAARLSKIIASPELAEEVRVLLRPFLEGRVAKVSGAYDEAIYRAGGNASAWMLVRGLLPEARERLVAAAETLCRDFPRDPEGIFEMPNHPGHLVWIDSVFGVCPFLLWVGTAANRPEFIDEAARQMALHHRLLFDPVKKLYRQARKNGRITPPCWGRGVGWGVLAMAELVYDLPKDHPLGAELRDGWRELMEGCLAGHDAEGLWHQVVEDHETYTETSGSALILYGMGRGLKNGSLPRERYLEPFLRGMRALTGYIALDGSVFNTCVGCLAPGEGEAADYAAKPHARNDIHSFGPMLYAFSQAEQLARNNLIPQMK